MSMDFINRLQDTLNNKTRLTENGALGYAYTGKKLLDLNFKVTSLRQMSHSDIYKEFIKAYNEDKLLAIKWLFYLRDIRGGLGERRSFRVILNRLGNDYPNIVKELIPLVAEYGRFDDLFCLLETDLRDEVIKYCYLIFLNDNKKNKDGEPISLLAKWLPSFGTKYDNYAHAFAHGFNLSKRQYSLALKTLRDSLNIVECKMSRNKWNEIKYEAVPSKANLKYNEAFNRHDFDRRQEYLSSLSKGKVKINAETLFPHDIYHQYISKQYDETLEQLWKALPDYEDINKSTLVVCDSSYSMTQRICKNTLVEAIEVSNALSIYFSSKCKGEFKDKFITFGSRPELVDLSNCDSLYDKIRVCLTYDDCSNTDLYAVFKLILDTSAKDGYNQDTLPDNVLIISDMEFDNATTERVDSTLLDKIEIEYASHGLKMPRLIFNNIISRTNVIPIKENEFGVSLISGYSTAIMKMILSNELDPYKCLVEQLNSSRYNAVEEAFRNAKK